MGPFTDFALFVASGTNKAADVALFGLNTYADCCEKKIKQKKNVFVSRPVALPSQQNCSRMRGRTDRRGISLEAKPRR